jgi:Astacin (Peptidase family M12A)
MGGISMNKTTACIVLLLAICVAVSARSTHEENFQVLTPLDSMVALEYGGSVAYTVSPQRLISPVIDSASSTSNSGSADSIDIDSHTTSNGNVLVTDATSSASHKNEKEDDEDETASKHIADSEECNAKGHTSTDEACKKSKSKSKSKSAKESEKDKELDDDLEDEAREALQHDPKGVAALNRLNKRKDGEDARDHEAEEAMDREREEEKLEKLDHKREQSSESKLRREEQEERAAEAAELKRDRKIRKEEVEEMKGKSKKEVSEEEDKDEAQAKADDEAAPESEEELEDNEEEIEKMVEELKEEQSEQVKEERHEQEDKAEEAAAKSKKLPAFFDFTSADVNGSFAKFQAKEPAAVFAASLPEHDRKALRPFMRLCFSKPVQRTKDAVRVPIDALSVCQYMWKHHPVVVREAALLLARPNPPHDGEELEDGNAGQSAARHDNNEPAPTLKDKAKESDSAVHSKALNKVSELRDLILAKARSKIAKQDKHESEDEDEDEDEEEKEAVKDAEKEVDEVANKESLLEVNTPIAKKKYLWKDGIVYYTFDKSITAKARADFEEAADWWEAATCLRFRERKSFKLFSISTWGKSLKDRVDVSDGEGCEADIADQTSDSKTLLNFWLSHSTTMRISEKCGVGNVAHELGHVVGMLHAHTTQNRDEYVMPYAANMMPGTERNFASSDPTLTDDVGPYDYGSIMHYGPWEFSKNGEPTLYSKKQGAAYGQRINLSPLDINAVNEQYSCFPNKGGKCSDDRVIGSNGLCVIPGKDGDLCKNDDDCEVACTELNICGEKQEEEDEDDDEKISKKQQSQ